MYNVLTDDYQRSAPWHENHSEKIQIQGRWVREFPSPSHLPRPFLETRNIIYVSPRSVNMSSHARYGQINISIVFSDFDFFEIINQLSELEISASELSYDMRTVLLLLWLIEMGILWKLVRLRFRIIDRVPCFSTKWSLSFQIVWRQIITCILHFVTSVSKKARKIRLVIVGCRYWTLISK